jgi:type II secretion system protein J
MRRREPRSRRKGGFTLLEVLVAVALSSVIMIALFGVFDSVTDVAIGIRQHEETAYDDRTLEAVLFDDLGSAYVNNNPDFVFTGKGGSFLGVDDLLMGFCTSASLNSAEPGPSLSLQRVEYLLKGGQDGRDLYRRERSFCGLTGEWDWVEVPVLRGLEEMEVEYLDTEDNTFVTEWANEMRAPGAVMVRVTHLDGREHEFMVRLSAQAVKAE